MSSANKITYILGGGFMKKTPDQGRAFYRTIIGDHVTANILICCFAMPNHKWQDGYEDDKERIISFNNEASLSFQIANLENFKTQVNWANVIIFRGGSTDELMSRLNSVQGWQNNLTGKTIVGSSAGAYILASSYVMTNKKPKLAIGFGLLPVVIATHYRSTFIHDGNIDKSQTFWDKVDNLMKKHANGRDIIALKEGDFITLTSVSQ